MDQVEKYYVYLRKDGKNWEYGLNLQYPAPGYHILIRKNGTPYRIPEDKIRSRSHVIAAALGRMIDHGPTPSNRRRFKKRIK